MTVFTKQGTSELAIRSKNGDNDAFRELEEVARPLLVSLSAKFAKYHQKLEFDDFYSIGLSSLYTACLSYSDNNPSFLDYAKIIILRDFWRQIKYWNAERRNLFANKEVSVESLVELGLEPTMLDNMEESAFMLEFRGNIESIIDECFNEKKAKIIKMHLFDGCKIIEISNDMELNYNNVYFTIHRGVKKIAKEYACRYLP